MSSAYRTFAGLLSVLFVLVALSLAGSWHIRHHLAPDAFDRARSDQLFVSEQARIQALHSARTWTTTAQISALAVCAILCGYGLRIRRKAAQQAASQDEAERELERERRTLERRIQERTRELRQEVDERRRAEELNRGQKQVLEMLASPAEQPTEEILRHLTATVASQDRSWECAVHLLDEDGRQLRLIASSDVSHRLGIYLSSIARDFADAPESQACMSGQPCVVEKMADMKRPWSEFLVANGICSAFSIPFRTEASRDVAGTLSIYSPLQGAPSVRELETAETAAKLAALVIEHRRIHSELVQNAYQDALTGLPNRRAGENALEAAVQKARERNETLAILWVDLDRFKRVNDQHGHSAGDHVLRTIADRIRRHRCVTGTAARMGGDEFLVLIPGPGSQDRANIAAEDLLSAIAEPITLGGRTFSISASIGICIYPRDGGAIDLLERHADAAMYRAKAAGSGSCIYSPAMSAEVQQRLEIEEALAMAVEENYLKAAYQPVYTAHGQLVGFEALLRFSHPTLGDLPPSILIPVAEETRRIVSIGNWILREACRQLREWHDAGLPWVRMSVNISAMQFAREDFAQTVETALSDNEVPAEYLTLELTESVVMDDNRSAVRQMSLLKTHGVRIAMDDFGTGYSSLSYLHRLPIDVLKIDRSFVERLHEPDGTKAIVHAIISMARHLGLTIVGEGVETQQQHHMLRQAGCDAVQGYLFARPMPPHQAQACLSASASILFANPYKLSVVPRSASA